MADNKKNQTKSPSKKSIVAQAEAKADKIVKDNAKAKGKTICLKIYRFALGVGHNHYCKFAVAKPEKSQYAAPYF